MREKPPTFETRRVALSDAELQEMREDKITERGYGLIGTHCARYEEAFKKETDSAEIVKLRDKAMQEVRALKTHLAMTINGAYNFDVRAKGESTNDYLDRISLTRRELEIIDGFFDRMLSRSPIAKKIEKEPIEGEIEIFKQHPNLAARYDDPAIRRAYRLNNLSDDELLEILADCSNGLDKVTDPEYQKQQKEWFIRDFIKLRPHPISTYVEEEEEKVDPLFDFALPIDKEELARRLQHINIQHTTKFDAWLRGRNLDSGGYCEQALGFAVVSVDEDPSGDPYGVRSGEIRHARTHELTHAVSGAQNLLYVDKEYPGELSHREERIGLSFYNFTKQKAIFTWLNEAITETLAQLSDNVTIEAALRGQSHKGAYMSPYASERILLRLLLTRGKSSIRLQQIIDAYFESYDPSARSKGEDPIPKWKDLRKAINEAYSPTFLLRLDEYIEKFGAAKAVEVMDEKDGWKEIDSFKGIEKR